MYPLYPNLCAEMDKANLNIACLAEKLNIPEQSVIDKLNGTVSWLLGETVIIAVLLKNPDLKFIFFKNIINENFWKVKEDLDV